MDKVRIRQRRKKGKEYMQERLEVKGLGKQDLRGFCVSLNKELTAVMKINKSDSMTIKRNRMS